MVLQKNITPLISVLNCSFLSEKWTTLTNLLVSGYIFCVGRATLAEPAESGGARGQMPHSTKRAYTSWSPQKFWTFLRPCYLVWFRDTRRQLEIESRSNMECMHDKSLSTHLFLLFGSGQLWTHQWKTLNIARVWLMQPNNNSTVYM